MAIRRAAEPAAVLHDPARAVGLVGVIRAALDLELFLQAPLGLAQPRLARTRHRTRLLGATLIKTTARIAQPAATALAGRDLGRQLVATSFAMDLVLCGVDRLSLFEDLSRDLLIAHRLIAARVCVNLRAVDRDDADANQARFGAQLEHAAEQLGQRVLVALDKPRDRRVIRRATAAITRNPTSSLQARSIARDDRVPRA